MKDHTLFAQLRRDGSLRQAEPPPRGRGRESDPESLLPAGQKCPPGDGEQKCSAGDGQKSPPRGRGRPTGTRSKCDGREGRASGRHPEPETIEMLRMACLDTIAGHMPLAFRWIDDRILDTIEKELDRTIRTILSKSF